VEFTGCKLTGSRFERCALRPLRVIGGDWSFVVLPGSDLRGCAFEQVRMREADLSGANCVDSVFTSVDLSGAMLHSAKFARADLRGSDLTALDPLVTDVADARILPEQAVVIAQALGLRVGP
jgi:fluoroquinolone resistance protein